MPTTVTIRAEELVVTVPGAGGVSALLRRPDDASAMLALAHGAGAGMRHVFMDSIARRLADADIATLRYQFPSMERGDRRPDRTPVAVATVRAAVALARAAAPDLPLLAGGKSFGGRMTSTAAAEEPLPEVRGIVFLGFPLHPAGRAGTDRAEHLAKVTAPMLFLQGTRDRLADLDLITQVCANLGSRATLRVIDGADHGFHVLRRSGRTDEDVLAELARAVADWPAAA